MSLPSLDQLRLVPVGMDGSSSPPAGKRKAPFDAAPMIKKLVDSARENVVTALANAPAMLCLQDNRASSLNAALQVLTYLKAHRDDGQRNGAPNQYDDEADMRRWEAAAAQGQRLPVVTAFRNSLLAPIRLHVDQVKARLRYISSHLASELGASCWLGNPAHPRNNLGWAVSYTDRYGEPDHFNFHTDMPPGGRRAHLPAGAADWAMLTMVYYILDSEAEELTKDRMGQGSTLYNLQGAAHADANTNVAFCPLKNGSIAVFDGTKYHAVGPNYGVGRGAVIHKCVLHKPMNTSRQWTHDVWWKEIQKVLLRMTCSGTEGFGVIPNGQAMLCDTLRPPSGAAGSSNA